MAGDYLTTGVPFEAMPLAEIRDPVLTGPGHGPIEAAVDTYRQLAERLQAAGDAVRDALVAARGAHEGVAAEASAHHIAGLIRPGDVGAAQARLAAMALEDQATYHVRVRNDLEPLRLAELQPFAGRIRRPTVEEREEPLQQQAAAAANLYQSNTNHNLMTAFQPFQPPEPVTLDLAAAPPPPPGPAVGGNVGVADVAPANDAAPVPVSPAAASTPAPVAPAPGVAPSGGAVPPEPVPAVGPASPVPVVAPPPSGGRPPVADAPGTPLAPGTVPQAVPRPDDGILRGTPPPTPRDVPAAGPPPLAMRDGVISAAPPWTAARPPETPGRVPPIASDATHARGVSEVGPARPGAQAEPTRPGSAPRPPIAPAYGHVPFLGTPAGAARDEEHRRPSWLVEDDPEALWFGELPPHVDPVIRPDEPM